MVATSWYTSKTTLRTTPQRWRWRHNIIGQWLLGVGAYSVLPLSPSRRD